MKQYTHFNNIRELIEASAEKFSERPAFRIKNKAKSEEKYRDVTYSILKEEIERLGSYLIDNGLQGKRIAVIGRNCYEWMLVYLSVLCTDGVIVPLDCGLFESEVKEQLERSEAEAIFYTEMFEEALKDKDNIIKIRMDEDGFKKIAAEHEISPEYEKISIDGDKMSILLFTSGTTSKSKAVMLSHKNVTANIYAMNIWEDFDETDINMAFLPFHHTFGTIQVVLFLSFGMCNVFCEGLRIAKCLNEYGVTTLVAVPRVIEEIQLAVFKNLKKQNKFETVNKGIRITSLLRKFGIDIRRKIFKQIIDGLGGGLRTIIVGAAAAKPETLNWFNDIGILAIQGYGLTESSPVIAAENEKNMRTGSVGKALPGVDVKIVDKDENGIGEIIAKGENIMLGYYKNEAENPIKDGYLYTGDMGYMDKNGYLFITGRKKNVIVLNNGKNVFPEELEALLNDSDAIKECIVMNKKHGDKDCIHAKIVYNTDFEKEEAEEKIRLFIDEINEKLVNYKQIRSFEIQETEMEKTTTLKIKR